MTAKPKPLKAFSVRADATKLAQAASLGVDLGATFRRALDIEISIRRKVCITCGSKKNPK